ncbi:CAP domain-containing protein, partial [Szabonella alba]
MAAPLDVRLSGHGRFGLDYQGSADQMPTAQNTPTADEQLMLELTNRARIDPAGEFDALILNAATQTGVQTNISAALDQFNVDMVQLRSAFEALTPAAPLAWNTALARAAEGHTELMLENNAQSHQFPGEPNRAARIAQAGYPNTPATVSGENVYGYSQDVLFGHAGFFIDWGVAGAGHRENIMDSRFTEIGIAILAGPGATGQVDTVGPFLVTQNLASRAGYQAQLLGVVIDDQDSDRFYDIGEGMGGITVTATGTGGTFTTHSWGSGGYQMVLPNGSYTVSFTGAGLEGAARYTVSIGGANVKLDAFAADFAPVIPPLLQIGSDLADTLLGGTGNDTIRGEGGNDVVYGGLGNDDLAGGAGNDVIFGDAGSNILWGGLGNDTVQGGSGSDTIHGGGDGTNHLLGNDGNDLIHAGSGGDFIGGGAG